MAQNWGVRVEGLAELRRDIKRAIAGTPTEITQAIKEAGGPARVAVVAETPQRTGRLAAGWRVSAAGATGSVTNRVPYAGGAVWAQRGKWRGFQKYGPPPRFGPPGIERASPQIQAILSRHLETIVSFYGWGSVDG